MQRIGRHAALLLLVERPRRPRLSDGRLSLLRYHIATVLSDKLGDSSQSIDCSRVLLTKTTSSLTLHCLCALLLDDVAAPVAHLFPDQVASIRENCHALG